MQKFEPVIRQDRITLTRNSKFFVKLNLLVTLLAIGLASRPELIENAAQSATLHIGSSDMAAEPPKAHPTVDIKHLRLHKSEGFPSLLDKFHRPITTAELP